MNKYQLNKRIGSWAIEIKGVKCMRISYGTCNRGRRNLHAAKSLVIQIILIIHICIECQMRL